MAATATADTEDMANTDIPNNKKLNGRRYGFKQHFAAGQKKFTEQNIMAAKSLSDAG